MQPQCSVVRGGAAADVVRLLRAGGGWRRLHRKQISELERSSGTPFGTICRSGLCLTSAISSFGGSLAVRWNRQRTLWGVGLSIQRPRPLVLRLRLHFPRAYLFVLFHVWVEGKKKSSRLAYFSRRVLARRPADQPYTLGLKEVDNISVTITIGIANAYQIQVVLLVFFSARLGRKATVRQLHAAVQAEQKAKLGAGRHIGPGG